MLAMMRVVRADASEKLSKTSVSYRDAPNGSKRCATCAHFIPATTPERAAACQIVAGAVDPQGYCMVWTQRNPTDSC